MIRVEFGRDGRGSSESVVMEQAANFVKRHFAWLKPSVNGWAIDCDAMRKVFPNAVFPAWALGTLPTKPILETEGRRSDTIRDGVRTEGRSIILKVVMLVTENDVNRKKMADPSQAER